MLGNSYNKLLSPFNIRLFSLDLNVLSSTFDRGILVAQSDDEVASWNEDTAKNMKMFVRSKCLVWISSSDGSLESINKMISTAKDLKQRYMLLVVVSKNPSEINSTAEAFGMSQYPVIIIDEGKK